MGIKALLKKNDDVFFLACNVRNFLRDTLPSEIFGDRRDIKVIEKRFFNTFGRKIDWANPKTLNEKIQWLKVNVREDFHTQCADKYAAREIWKQFGEDGLIPLLYQTYNWKDITLDVIPDEPCIIKSNTGSGFYQIIRDKNTVDINELRKKCRLWMSDKYYYRSQEWQYKNIKPCILIEKLLLDSQGHIPNDYKLNFINGKLEFIYCSIDREGANYRSIYSPDWERLDVEWVAKADHKGGMIGENIAPPKNFERMVSIGTEIAKKFCYVRVDFYEVDDRLYYGEITLHHGSGFDTFEPEKYDYIYGAKLVLPFEEK